MCTSHWHVHNLYKLCGNVDMSVSQIWKESCTMLDNVSVKFDHHYNQVIAHVRFCFRFKRFGTPLRNISHCSLLVYKQLAVSSKLKHCFSHSADFHVLPWTENLILLDSTPNGAKTLHQYYAHFTLATCS